MYHLSARLKVWVSERPGSLQEFLHMIPAAFPVTPEIYVSSICSHAEYKPHQTNTERSDTLKTQQWRHDRIMAWRGYWAKW